MTSHADERRAARLAAVQALYQMEMMGSGAEEVAQEFIEHRFGELPVTPDRDFFSAILNGVPQNQVEIDRAIAGALSEKWKLERVDSILRAILRGGVFELVGRRDVPAKVVIDEYVAVAGDFLRRRRAGLRECGAGCHCARQTGRGIRSACARR